MLSSCNILLARESSLSLCRAIIFTGKCICWSKKPLDVVLVHVHVNFHQHFTNNSVVIGTSAHDCCSWRSFVRSCCSCRRRARDVTGFSAQETSSLDADLERRRAERRAAKEARLRAWVHESLNFLACLSSYRITVTCTFAPIFSSCDWYSIFYLSYSSRSTGERWDLLLLLLLEFCCCFLHGLLMQQP